MYIWYIDNMLMIG